MGVTFSNKFSTTLSSGINNSVTSLSVASATGFPSLSGGAHTYVTLDNGDSTTIEVVKVTAISSTTLTIVRGQDSTSAAAFSAGAKVELRLTTALLQDVKDEGPDDSVLKVDQSNNRVGILNASPDVTLDVGSATDSMHVPVGTTGQRPGSPAAGYFRYNSTNGEFEGYTDEWGAIGGSGATNVTLNEFTGDGSTTAYTLSVSPGTEINTQVYIEGVYQEKATYAVSGTTLTFSTAPPNTYSVEVLTFSESSVGVAADGSISTVKIADDAVTYAKIQNVSATDRILGRDSASAGIIEEITPANVRTMLNVADGANAYVHPNHSGDVTSSADGATTIAADAVTYAKMQDVSATDRLLGRDTSGAGVVEEIAPAAVRTMINVADGANAYVHPNHSGEVTSTADGATTIANDAVTAAKIADDAVVTAAIADDAVVTAAIADDAITAALIADDAVVQAAIADEAIDEARIQISNAGTNGQYLQKQSGDTGGLTWADVSGGLTLVAVQTSAFTAAAGNQYLCNTSGGAFNVTLPSGSAGDTIGIIDYNGTFDTNNLTLVQSGSEKIFRVDANGTIDTKNWSTSIKYMDATVGWLPAGD